MQHTILLHLFFFFSSSRRHTILVGDWSSDVCSSDLRVALHLVGRRRALRCLRGPLGRRGSALVRHLFGGGLRGCVRLRRRLRGGGRSGRLLTREGPLRLRDRSCSRTDEGTAKLGEGLHAANPYTVAFGRKSPGGRFRASTPSNPGQAKAPCAALRARGRVLLGGAECAHAQ